MAKAKRQRTAGKTQGGPAKRRKAPAKTRKTAKTSKARATKPARKPAQKPRPAKKATSAKALKNTARKKLKKTAKRAKRAPQAQQTAKARVARPKTKPAPPAASRFPSVPSSLDMVRRASAVGSGRLELADERRKHSGMSPAITAGDADVDVESAYFTGDEAPGGDNPAPDQEVVDEIGKALGVEYQDDEELRGSEKVIERDRHRWELDPASSEDYPTRK